MFIKPTKSEISCALMWMYDKHIPEETKQVQASTKDSSTKVERNTSANTIWPVLSAIMLTTISLQPQFTQNTY